LGAVPPELTLEVPAGWLDAVAQRAAEIVLAHDERRCVRAAASPYLNVAEAAEYLRAKPQRVYDLLSSRRLTRFKDGSRTLVSRAELDAYLENGRPSSLVR
jgi:excisionase family DNA binding protein